MVTTGNGIKYTHQSVTKQPYLPTTTKSNYQKIFWNIVMIMKEELELKLLKRLTK